MLNKSINTLNIRQAILMCLCGLLYFPHCLGQSRGFSEAKIIASNFTRPKDPSQVEMITCSSDILKRSPLMDESFYVYTKGHKGFVIVSGNKLLPDILAFSDSSTFDIQNIPDNVRYWLSTYDNISLDASSTIKTQSQIEGIKSEGVAPLLGNIQWGQGLPYNSFCPMYNGSQCVTGCVATAMAMVMKSYQYPQCGNGDLSYTTSTHHINVSRQLDNYPFAWSDMLDQYDRTASTQQKNAVANLMVACGTSVKMDYAPDGSGAYQYDMLKAYIDNFNYDSDAAFLIRDFFSSDTWHNLLVKELNEGRPVNYAGSNRVDGGHSFVIDGYKTEKDSQLPYYHLNWGWSGNCDGYYYLSDLHPREKGQNYTSRAFDEGQQMLIGIKPDDGISDKQWALCTDDISLSKPNGLQGERFTISISSIYNLSYKSFTGNIYIVLDNEEGENNIIGKKSITELDFMMGTNRISFDCAIPTDIEEGEYQLIVKAGESIDAAVNIYAPHEIKFTVGESSSTGDTLAPPILCTSEIEVFKESIDESRVNLRVYEVFNYCEDTFSGLVQCLLRNRNNQIISALGDSIPIMEMLSRDLIDSPLLLTFHFPDSLANGTHRLFVGAKKLNANNYKDLMYYDRVTDEPPHSYCLDVIVFDHEIRIGNLSFPRIVTSIHELSRMYNEDYNKAFYTAEGIKQTKEKPGLNIVRLPDGTFKKVYIKQ